MSDRATLETNKAVVRRYLESVAAFDLDAMVEFEEDEG